MDKKKLGMRITAMFLTVLMIFTIVPFSASAANIIDSGKCGDNVYWTLYDDGELVISGEGDMYNYAADTIDRVSIFSPREKKIKIVTIKPGVTSICNNAFIGCESLISVAIPKSVTSIGRRSFYMCFALTDIKIHEGVTLIGDQAFYGCQSMTSIIIPHSMDSISWMTFGECTSLTSITIPDSITVIENGAFTNCKSLKTIYYTGTQNQWNEITIDYSRWDDDPIWGAENDCLKSANIVFNDNHSETLSIVDAYKRVLQTYQSEDPSYTIYDIDKDNVPELIICVGLYNANRRYKIYTFNNGQAEYLDEEVCGYSKLYGADGQNGVYVYYNHTLYVQIKRMSIIDNQLSSSTVIELNLDAGDDPSALDKYLYNHLRMVSTDDYTLLEELTNDPIMCNHKWGSWVTTRAATCTASGAQIRYCSVCAGSETREIAALGHSYSSEWTIDVAATSTTEGSKSHHCIRCEAKTDVTPIEKQTKTMPDGYNFETDSYSFGNYERSIGNEYFETMFGDRKGFLLWKKERNAGGQCFGMTYTTAALLNDLPGGYTIRKLKNIGNDIINFSSTVKIGTHTISIRDYIAYAHIYQYSTNVVNGSVWTNGTTIYNLVRQYLSNDNIGVTIGMTRRDGKGGHRVLAVGIDGNDILIDDPNNTKLLERLTVNSDGSWSFSGLNGWNSDTCYIRYNLDWQMPYKVLKTGTTVVADDSFINDSSTSENYIVGMDIVDKDNLLLFADGDYTVCNENTSQIIIDSIDEDSDSESGEFYWIDKDETINVTTQQDDNEIILAGNDSTIGVETDAASDMTFTMDEGTETSINIDSTQSDEYKIYFESTDENGDDVITTITGTASGDTVTAYEVEDGIEVTGLNDITVTLETADGTDKAIADITEGEKVSIDIDKENNEISISVPDSCEHDYYVSDYNDPLCDVDGYTEYACSICGDTYTETIPAQGHDYISTVTSPTCTDDGETEYICSVCGDTYTEIIPATGHDGVETVIDGETCIVCSVCGEILSYDDNMSTFLDIFYPEDFVIGDECILYIGLPSEGVESGVITIYYPSDIVSPTTFSCYADYAESYVLEDGVMQIEFSFDFEAPCDYDDFVDLNFELLSYGSVEFSVETDWIGKENPECAFLYADFAPPSDYTLGDVNNDGQVTAADARLALRISAQLETADDYMMLAADADKNGRITAADARKILRVSAKLESF